MAGKFAWFHFWELNKNDSIFDSLKEDYPPNSGSKGFVQWFAEKAKTPESVLTFEDEYGLGAFLYLKDEGGDLKQGISLDDCSLPVKDRIKIGTFKLADRYQGKRLGEGALGIALWRWQESKYPEIYVTIFSKHTILINLFEKFGFICAGILSSTHERVYIKSKDRIDFSDPYKCFPFITPLFKKAGFLIINDKYHDNLFPYSELKNNIQEAVEASAANGLTKIYISSSFLFPHYCVGEPVLIYRKYTQKEGRPYFKSAITSFCTVTNILAIKQNFKFLLSYEEMLDFVQNKVIDSIEELSERYSNSKNLFLIELLYNGYFGEGNNINFEWLSKEGYFSSGIYPADVQLNREQFLKILNKGGIDESAVIIS